MILYLNYKNKKTDFSIKKCIQMYVNTIDLIIYGCMKFTFKKVVGRILINHFQVLPVGVRFFF